MTKPKEDSHEGLKKAAEDKYCIAIDRRKIDLTATAVQQEILDKLEAIEEHQKASLELLNLFNSTKGFISTVRGIGVFMLWTTAIFGAGAVIIYNIRVWIKGP